MDKKEIKKRERERTKKSYDENEGELGHIMIKRKIHTKKYIYDPRI